jgi:dTDP-4-dehydrorhamnose reductase
MKYLIFGNGWIGNRLLDLLPDAQISQVDILDIEAVKLAIEVHTPDVVINAAGKTGKPNIDWCEASNDNRRLTTYVNAFGARNVADACTELGAKLVHISSGCLWGSGANMTETDRPEYVSHYSRTKAQGEAMVSAFCPSALILRIRMPIDTIEHPRNLLCKLLAYDTILNERQSVTPVQLIADSIEHLCERAEVGIFNVAASGYVTAREIIEIHEQTTGEKQDKKYVTAQEFARSGLATAGRSNCTLSVVKLTKTGLNAIGARDAVWHCYTAMTAKQPQQQAGDARMKIEMEMPEPPKGYEWTGRIAPPTADDHYRTDGGKARRGPIAGARPLLRRNRWRAEKGRTYHFVSTTLDVMTASDGREGYSNGLYSAGNYFKTKAEAEVVADKMREVLAAHHA